MKLHHRNLNDLVILKLDTHTKDNKSEYLSCCCFECDHFFSVSLSFVCPPTLWKYKTKSLLPLERMRWVRCHEEYVSENFFMTAAAALQLYSSLKLHSVETFICSKCSTLTVITVFVQYSDFGFSDSYQRKEAQFLFS